MHSVDTDSLCCQRTFDHLFVLAIYADDPLGRSFTRIFVDVFRRIELAANLSQLRAQTWLPERTGEGRRVAE